MNLLNNIKNEVEYIDNIAYLDIEGYLFFYYVLNDKEVFAISLNKPLISKEDLKLFNIKLNKKAVCTVDNIAYKNDLLYVEIIDNNLIIQTLKKLKDILYSMTYKPRENCIVCGKKALFNNYKNALVPIDKQCIDKLNEEEQTIKNTYKDNINKSMLLSILGGFIGIIPAIIVTLILGSYSIISTILLFLVPFLTILFYNNTPIYRSKKSDVINALTSLGFIVIYHIIMIILFTILYTITSIDVYIEAFNYLLLETLLETIFAYVIGLLSGYYLSKKRVTVRFSKQNSEKY